jgi:hypothetical protein
MLLLSTVTRDGWMNFPISERFMQSCLFGEAHQPILRSNVSGRGKSKPFEDVQCPLWF